MKYFILSLMSLFLIISFSSDIQAQFGYPCEFNPRQGYTLPITHRHLRVNFHETNRTATLIDSHNREIYLTLSTDAEAFGLVAWSPTCRYFAAHLRTSAGYSFRVWETETGIEVVNIDKGGSRLRWSPDERYILAHTSNENNRRSEIIIDTYTNSYSPTIPWTLGAAWDLENNRLYVIHYRERDAVHAYQLPTGQHLATYAPQNPEERIFATALFLSNDRTHLVYYTRYTDALHIDGSLDTNFNGCASGIAVYNIATVQGQIIDTGCEDLAAGYGDARQRLNLSPDNRYIVLAYNQIRVWDLQALNPDSQANWSFEGPDYQVRHLRFLDNQIIETFAYRESRYALRWNLFTGEYLNTFDYQTNTEVNRDGSPLD